MSRALALLLLPVLSASLAADPQRPGPPRPGQPGPGRADGADTVMAPERVAGGPDYRIGADDQLTIMVLQAPELNTTARVSDQGAVSLPLLGVVRASGLTALELERAIEEQYGEKYIKNPEVTVHVTDVRSHPVSVVGAVRRPGILQVRGSTTLLEVLSLAGGLAEDAGDSLVVLHKDVEAPPTEVRLKALMEARDPSLNVPIHPGDVVNVRGADVVYVVGAVNKPGAFAMPGNDRVTVLRALALGEGLAQGAAQKDALVVRTGEGGRRVEIPVDLSALLKGKAPDVPLEAHDVLFVPASGGKAVARAALDAFVRILTWRPF